VNATTPVRLLVDDFYGCFHFLQDSLGLECTGGDDDAGYASFKSRPAMVAALKRDRYANVIELRAAGEGALSVLEVEDVEAEAARLADAVLGGPVTKAAWGGRVVYVRDPGAPEVG
jgi:lactoylglutathione lyase